MKGLPWIVVSAALSFLLCLNESASGAGFAVLEQSTKGLGNAFAGGAASAEDATTVFYNPAGLARLNGSQVVAGFTTIFPSAEFRNEGSEHFTGQPLRGPNGGDAGVTILVPNLYLSHALTDKLSVGLGVFSPFGLSTHYDPSWVGRYYAVKSDLRTVNINPSAAYRITDHLSVGAGIDIQYMKAELSNAIDFGSIFGALGFPGMAPQGNDGSVNLKADSWGWGYNAGVLYEFNQDTRAGIAYRSRIKQKLKGDADFSGVPSPNPTGQFLNTGIRADITTPDSASFSLWHNISKEFALMGDITWTNWSVINELRIRFDNSAQSDAVTTTNWRNTFRYALGAVYMPDKWMFRTGVAYERTPIPDAGRRTPRLPDSDRIWLAAGAGLRISKMISVDAGYAHLFINDPEIHKTATGEDTLLGGLSGSYKARVDIASIQLTWAF